MEPGTEPPRPRRRRGPALNALLFLATVASTLLVGSGHASLPEGEVGLGTLALAGLPYASAILGILVAHELGHYLMARAWGVDTTLPFFIPGPPPAGTFGALIRMRSALPSRRAVLDIGIAGPLAGLAVALPLLAWGLSRSEVRPIGDALAGASNAGSPFAVLRALWEGQPILGDGSGIELMGDSLLSWGLTRLVVGPLPPGHDVFLHPVAFAGWLGLLVTTLNLLPIGQLDGGHVLYAWLGRARALRVARLVAWGLLAAGFFLTWTWLMWWVITRFLVRHEHPPALDEEPLDRGRAVLAVLSLVLFALTFIPVPVSM